MQNQINPQIMERSFNLYISQLHQELKFLWQEAQSTDQNDMKERKLKQFWDLYRFYRKQKEYIGLLE